MRRIRDWNKAGSNIFGSNVLDTAVTKLQSPLLFNLRSNWREQEQAATTTKKTVDLNWAGDGIDYIV